MILTFDLMTSKPSSSTGYASWVWRQRHSGCILIVIQACCVKGLSLK